MPAGSDPIESLLDILELVERIERQTGALTRDQFLADDDVQDATAYRLLAIGEAAKGIGDDTKSRYPDVPWWSIVGMRNVLAHEYFVRESAIIWETVQLGLPRLGAVCRAELKRLGWSSGEK
jgi:uncharacterized protein with HEPN domain